MIGKGHFQLLGHYHIENSIKNHKFFLLFKSYFNISNKLNQFKILFVEQKNIQHYRIFNYQLILLIVSQFFYCLI